MWTDGQGKVTIGIPPNRNGLGYVCYSRAGIVKPSVVPRLAATQVFEGAPDLDIGPAIGGQNTPIGRIWCDAGFPVALQPETAAAHLVFSLLDPAGNQVEMQNGKGRTRSRGWHTLTVTSSATGPTSFRLAVTYTGSQFL
jgi:hypothetical protein